MKMPSDQRMLRRLQHRQLDGDAHEARRGARDHQQQDDQSPSS
jgi:hypothetical protein